MLQLSHVAREISFGFHPVASQRAHGQAVSARGTPQPQVNAAGVQLGQRSKRLGHHQWCVVGQHDAT